MFSFHGANNSQLLTAATAFSITLAQGQSPTQLSRMAAFFTLVGDTLALLALEPEETDVSTEG